MIVADELVSALARRIRNEALIANAMRQLDAFSQVELTGRHRDVGVRLAIVGSARGADTAIAAQAIMIAAASGERVEFPTVDTAQGRLVRKEATTRRLDIVVVGLPS